MPDFPSTPSLIGMVQAFKPDPELRAAPLFPQRDSVTNSYQFDVVQGQRTKASYTKPDGAAGVNAARIRTRKTVTLPTIREKTMLRESTMRWMDAPGQKAPGRFREEIAAELKELDNLIERQHEYVRWQLLTTGAITLDGDETETLDFGIGTTASASVGWSTVATSDPVGDLVTWKESVQQLCGERATKLYLSTLAVKYLFESTKALTLLGEMTKDRFRESGTVTTLAGMEVEIIDTGYRDASDNFKYFLSDDGAEGNMAVIVAGSGPVGVTAQGPPNDSKAPDGLIGKFAKSWEQEDPSGRWVLETHTALPGLIKPNYVGAFTLW